MGGLVLACMLACVAGPRDRASDTGDTGAGSWADWSGDALLLAVGSATVLDGSYTGAEALSVLAERGDGPELCRIEYALDSAGPREDCADCQWAYDLDLGTPDRVVEIGAGCGPADAVLDELGGGPLPYGYTSEYLGHSDVLLTPVDDRWKPEAYAAWDPASGAFEYEWERGVVTIP